MTPDSVTLPAGAPARAAAVPRVAAAVGGALLLVGATVGTFGLALAGAVGVLVAGAVARRRRRRLTRGTSWVAAALAAGLAFGAYMAFAFAKMPPGTLAKIEHASDSARAAAHEKPLPAWVERVAPGASAARRQPNPMSGVAESRALMWWGMAMGFAVTGALFGGIGGTLGWGAAMLLAYAARGRWLARRADVPTTDPELGELAPAP